MNVVYLVVGRAPAFSREVVNEENSSWQMREDGER